MTATNVPAPAAGRRLPSSAPPAKKLRSQAAYGAVPEVPLPIEGRAPKLPASRGPGDRPMIGSKAALIQSTQG